MRKEQKKSGDSHIKTALQPDGCARKDTSILTHSRPLVTLAWAAIWLGAALTLVLGGQFDTELLTGILKMHDGEFTFYAIAGLSAIIIGLIVLKLEGAFND